MRAFGYALVEDERPGRFDPDEAERLGVSPGPDFARLQAGETVNGVEPAQVMGETRRGRKVVVTGDTEPCELALVAAHEAELLVHEASFADDGGPARPRDAPLDRPRRPPSWLPKRR